MSEPSDLSRHVEVDVSPARIARVWQGILPRLEQAPSRARRWFFPVVAAGGLAVAGVGAVVLAGRGPDPSSVWENAALESAGDSISVRLEDSSRIELAARSRIELAESQANAVKLRLRRGSVRCDVTHREGRRFSVEAVGIEVRVVGTLFNVAIADGERRVDVSVERGSVEVRAVDDTGAYRKLSAGERWSLELPRAPATGTTAAAQPPLPSAVPSGEAAEAPPSRPRDEPRVAEPSSSAVERADVDPSSDPNTATARELFDLANLARRSGDLAAAARAYELLLSKYPNDGRVGLAAFELGRLRLERLGNPAGAVSALERALAKAPSPGLREDAMARLVQAYAALGDGTRCRRTRDRYLSEYPGGVHANAVKSRCAER